MQIVLAAKLKQVRYCLRDETGLFPEFTGSRVCRWFSLLDFSARKRPSALGPTNKQELPVALANQRGSFSHYPAFNILKVNLGRRAPLGKIADPNTK
jgi:hypothetical protein